MLATFQVFTVLLVAIAWSLALAHALELPGKKRLPRDIYLAVQRIYYPGFTTGGGIGEFGGLIASILLAVLTPKGTAAFWLTVVAVLGLAGMQVVYWGVTHPVNRYWVRGEKLGRFGAGFFGAEAAHGGSSAVQHGIADWTRLRDRWEYSHVARAGLAGLSFVALVIACKVPLR